MADEAPPTRRMGPIGYLIAVVVIFLAGFTPAFLSVRRVRHELNQTSAQLASLSDELSRARLQGDLARLEGKLGLVVYEANRNNFANASMLAAQFFDGLRSALKRKSIAAVAKRSELEAILARSNEISGDLARADQAVKQKLADIYFRFDAALL